MNAQALRDMLIIDEGIRLKPYPDTEGKLTIGIGRNLTDVGISKSEAIYLCDNDITAVVGDLDKLLPWWRGMTEIRQQVLANMRFNMGLYRLMGFKQALAAMEAGKYDEAANQMMDSPWYNEVRGRGIRLVSLMRNGQ